jgi:hypothetical protein
MDQLGYTEEEAIEKVGIVLSAGCVLTALACASAGPIAKRYLFHYFFTLEVDIYHLDFEIHSE